MSAIEWTGRTWNPSTGCTKISPGCARCYAAVLSKRLKAMGQEKYAQEFEYVEHVDTVATPLSWRKPVKIFVNSMSDFCHENATAEFQDQCFYTMMEADRHIYQILTKRSAALVPMVRRFAENWRRPVPRHIWLGVSVESADYAYRIRDLQEAGCTTRFVSFEPLLGPIGPVDLSGIDWAIIGGESGAGYRPVKPRWIGDLIGTCRSQGVPIFFKQWGGIRPKTGGRLWNGRELNGWPAYLQGAAQ